MILTGPQIAIERRGGTLTIEPFEEGRINPNSYNYRLGESLYRVSSGPDGAHRSEPVELVDGRWLLQRGEFYLATTLETIGSDKFVTLLIGRSSVGRLGLFVQVSADLGHQGSIHRWTLELRPMHSIYAYPGQPIGQVSFWVPIGDPKLYVGVYGVSDRARMSVFNDAKVCE